MTDSFVKRKKAVTGKQLSLTDEMKNEKKIHKCFYRGCEDVFIREVLQPPSSDINHNVAYINGKHVDEDGNNRTCGPGREEVL